MNRRCFPLLIVPLLLCSCALLPREPRLTLPDTPEAKLGAPLSAGELTAWQERKPAAHPARWRVERLPNGGRTLVLDGRPFMPVGIDYEPLATYGEMKWAMVERDLDVIRDTGFNTVTVWCLDFHKSGGNGPRMSIDDMVRMAELAKARGLFIQFYLNVDRFTRLFPVATLPDGRSQGWDIDYADPGYRAFCRNFARRLAMALYPFDNVSTMVIWEEKVGLDASFPDHGNTVVYPFFGSAAGQRLFADFLKLRYRWVRKLNGAWGTSYESFDEAVRRSLIDYQRGPPDDDHRQFDILEFGTVLLADFTREFVDAYKSIDPSMLFQCRHFDLFGPVHALHPAYAFLDTFGLNQYSLGYRGPDLTFREEVVRTKLITGLARTAPYVGNYGFRTRAPDQGSHGLVPNEDVKASMACDTVMAFSCIPEMCGTSYYMYLYSGNEGPWDIVRDAQSAAWLPIAKGFQAVHTMMAEMNERIAASDYDSPAKVFVFHGLDAVFDLKQQAWLEHTTLSYDLTEMNLNYEVLTDVDHFDPRTQPVILANFHAYDKKLDADAAERLLKYCRRGGTLVIGNDFARLDRHLWPSPVSGETARARGVRVGELKRGPLKILAGGGLPDLQMQDAYYVEAVPGSLEPGGEVLLEMEVGGRRQPAMIRSPYGKGTLYYLLFNPYRQAPGWDQDPLANRTSLPVMAFLMRQAGIHYDSHFGNRGFDLADGRINIHEKPVHYFLSRDMAALGLYKDEYGEDDETYSGGVIRDDLLSFRGRRLNERGWTVETPNITSVFAWVDSNSLNCVSLDAVDLTLTRGKFRFKDRIEPYRIYRIPSPP